jgi:hypothetical protein
MKNWKAVAEVMERSASKGTARLILIGIAAHINRKTGTAYPGRKRLAELANCHPDTVRKCLSELEALGELEVDVQGGPGRSLIDKPNLYRILPFPRGGDLPSEDGDKAPTETHCVDVYVKEEKVSSRDTVDTSHSSGGESSPVEDTCSVGSRRPSHRPRQGSDREATRGVVRRPYAGQAKARGRGSERDAQ